MERILEDQLIAPGTVRSAADYGAEAEPQAGSAALRFKRAHGGGPPGPLSRAAGGVSAKADSPGGEPGISPAGVGADERSKTGDVPGKGGGHGGACRFAKRHAHKVLGDFRVFGGGGQLPGSRAHAAGRGLPDHPVLATHRVRPVLRGGCLMRWRSGGMAPAGDSVEITWIDSGFTQDLSQYVTELQVPVRSVGGVENVMCGCSYSIIKTNRKNPVKSSV